MGRTTEIGALVYDEREYTARLYHDFALGEERVKVQLPEGATIFERPLRSVEIEEELTSKQVLYGATLRAVSGEGFFLKFDDPLTRMFVDDFRRAKKIGVRGVLEQEQKAADPVFATVSEEDQKGFDVVFDPAPPEHYERIRIIRGSEEGAVKPGHHLVGDTHEIRHCCRAWGLNRAHWAATAVEYIARHKRKNGREDIEKAIRCLQIYLEEYEDHEGTEE